MIIDQYETAMKRQRCVAGDPITITMAGPVPTYEAFLTRK